MTLLRKYNAVQSGKALLSADYILDTAVPQNTGDTKINKVGHLSSWRSWYIREPGMKKRP